MKFEIPGVVFQPVYRNPSATIRQAVYTPHGSHHTLKQKSHTADSCEWPTLTLEDKRELLDPMHAMGSRRTISMHLWASRCGTGRWLGYGACVIQKQFLKRL